jgi:hypothetical protein
MLVRHGETRLPSGAVGALSKAQTTGSVEILTDASAVAVPALIGPVRWFTIFPNPASNVLNVPLPESHPLVGNASLLVVDLYGKIVLQKDLVLD